MFIFYNIFYPKYYICFGFGSAHPGAYSFVLGHFYDEKCGQTHYHEFEYTISINSQETCIKKKKKFAQERNNCENSQIPRFYKLCGNLALFQKYLAIYHSFSNQASWNQVLNSTRIH